MITTKVSRPRARWSIDPDDVVVIGVRGEAVVLAVTCPSCGDEHRHLWDLTSRGGPGWKTPPCGRDRAGNRYLLPEPAVPASDELLSRLAPAESDGRRSRRRPRPRIIVAVVAVVAIVTAPRRFCVVWLVTTDLPLIGTRVVCGAADLDHQIAREGGPLPTWTGRLILPPGDDR